LESFSRYIDIREPIQRVLYCSLRQETDPFNIQYALGLAAIFCVEVAEPELKRAAMLKVWKNENNNKKGNDEEAEICKEIVEGLFILLGRYPLLLMGRVRYLKSGPFRS